MTILSGDESSTAALVEDMTSEGFKCYRSSLGGQGVLFHDKGVPADMAAAAAVVKAVGVSGQQAAQRVSSGGVGGVKRKGLGTAAIAVAVAAMGLVLFVSVGQRARR